MTERSVLLDTSFFLRLFDTSSPLHENAKSYYKYFLEHDITLKISTIAIAEFCVKGEITDLPLRNMKIIPFNFDHAPNFNFIDINTPCNITYGELDFEQENQ